MADIIVYSMLRFRHWIILAVMCLLATGCSLMSDDRVNREILLSTVWRGERFVPKEPLPQDYMADESMLYVFGSNGILYIYPEISGTDGEPSESHRYIYTPSMDEMVIEDYGMFSVSIIDVDRMLLEGSSGTIDLYFYAGEDMLPVPEGGGY